MAERAMLGVAVLVVAARLVQATITVGFGSGFYSNSSTAWVAYLLALATSVGIGVASWRQGQAPEWSLGALWAVALASIALMASSTRPGDLTTSFNWSLPFAQSAALMLGLAPPKRLPLSIAGATLLTIAYTGSIALAGQQDRLALLEPAAGNAVGILAHYIGAVLVVGFVRKQAMSIDETIHLNDRRETQLRAEHARNKEFRRLHDDAVQVLERASAEPDPTSREIRRYAARAARELRAALWASPSASSLEATLAQLAHARLAEGMTIKLDWPDIFQPDVDAAVVEAVGGAVNEALNNVQKHAQVSEARIAGRIEGSQLLIRVEDRGAGFSPSDVQHGFGLAQSIRQPIEAVGGIVSIAAAPTRGTAVVLRVPLRRASCQPQHRSAAQIERPMFAIVLASRAAYVVYAAAVLVLNHSHYSDLAIVSFGLFLAASCAAGLALWAWRTKRISLKVAALDALTCGVLMVVVTQSLAYSDRAGSRNWAVACMVASVIWLAFGGSPPARLVLATGLGFTYYMAVVVGGTPTRVVEVTALSNAITPPIFFGVAAVVYAMVKSLASASDGAHVVELAQSSEAAALQERQDVYRRIHLPTIRALDTISASNDSTSAWQIRRLARTTARFVRRAIAPAKEREGWTALRREVESIESSRVRIDLVDLPVDGEPNFEQVRTLSRALALAISESSKNSEQDPLNVRVMPSSIGNQMALRVRMQNAVTDSALKDAEDLLARSGGRLNRLDGLDGELRIEMRVPS